MLLYALACASALDAGDAGSSTSLAVGDTAPDFVLLDQDGAELRLSDLAGKVVLVESAAEW